MHSVNKVHLIGQVIRDPELREGKGKHQFALIKFIISIKSGRSKDENGKFKDDFCTIDCELFKHRDEDGQFQFVLENLQEGCEVYLEGSLKQARWKQPKTGLNMSKMIVVVQGLRLLRSGQVRVRPPQEPVEDEEPQ